jgi:HlyD family secretion protein
MPRILRNRRFLFAVLIIAGLLALALWPETVPVDVATAQDGPLRVTIDEEGETRIRHRFIVSTPVAGRVLRVDLEPGDRIKRGGIVTRVQPEPPPLLDARTRAEAEASVEALRAALNRSRAEEDRARTTRDLALAELRRARELDAAGLTTRQAVEMQEAEARAAEEAVRAASSAVAVAQAELERAQARLRPPTSAASTGVVELAAPIDGVILKRFRESESVVPAGERLVEIGDPRDLEVVSDLLSTDAVRVARGARVLIAEWGGDRDLEARVRRIEPSGFTKISALGVEEQRVNVVMDFKDPADAWAKLGDAYRVEVRIVDWESERVLKIPTSALFRQSETWAVFVVRDGRVTRTVVDIGHRSGVEAEVKAGLSEGTVVVVHPSDTLADGARVELRTPAAR